MTAMKTPATAGCPTCGDTYLTANGKCSRCGAGAIGAATVDALPSAKSNGALVSIPAAKPKQADDPVELPASVANRRWVAATAVLLDKLKEQRKILERDIAASEQRLARLDIAIGLLSTTVGRLRLESSQPTTLRPERASAAVQIHKIWSIKHERCIDCGTASVPHVANGRCRSCDGKWRTGKRK